MRSKHNLIAAAIAAACAPGAALATNGYFSHGYGVKAQGMGGVGIALPQDSIAAATNPAGMAFVGDRFDLGLTWFRPTREATISGVPSFGPDAPNFNGTFNGNDKSNFFIPELGYNRTVGKDWTLGVSVYGHGGMNTSYTTPVSFFGDTNAGVDLSQLFIAPTAAWRITPEHALGLSLNIAYQRFEANGLQGFDNARYSQSPGSVTNNGYDTSWGYGVRVGYTGKLSDYLTVGATYQSKTSMQSFDKYKGLFANQGEFDIPANWGLGLAFKPLPSVNVALDVVWIQYSSIDAIANPLLPNFYNAQLGANGGPGFGWEDMVVYKLGIDYTIDPAVTLRVGYNYGRQPIPSSQTMFNILAPGVVQNHYTFGGTWNINKSNEVSFAFMYAPTVTVQGTGAIPLSALTGASFLPNANADIQLKEISFGLSWGWKF